MSGQKPGLLILDMSNDQMKGVLYNKAAVVSNVVQLAISAYFQVCVQSKEEVPAFRAKQKGAKLVDELVDLHHLKDLPKKTDSALSNPAVLETFKSVGVTHVCICGASTDSSVYATAKDLVDNGFEIYVVRDATTSKNGRFGHDKGLRRLQSEFGEQCVVGIDDLLGEEEVVEEEEAAVVPAPSPSPAAPMTDAERLAARKKQVDEARFAHIKQANAAAIANADEKRASEIRKDSTEAELFAQNLPQNKAPPVPEEAPASTAPPEKKGLLGGLFGRGKKEPKVTSSAAPEPAPTPMPVPTPTPKPVPTPATKPVSASAVPGGAAGQKTWIKPKPEGGKTTSYTPDGAVSQPLGVKKMVQGNDVQHRIAGLQAGGLSTVPMGPRTMKTPKIVTDTKETWDKQGNITREITRYITEIDGTKRTEKEIVKIPAKK